MRISPLRSISFRFGRNDEEYIFFAKVLKKFLFLRS